MMEMRSVGLVANNLFGLSRVKIVWDGVNALLTFIVGFAYLLAPGKDCGAPPETVTTASGPSPERYMAGANPSRARDAVLALL